MLNHKTLNKPLGLEHGKFKLHHVSHQLSMIDTDWRGSFFASYVLSGPAHKLLGNRRETPSRLNPSLVTPQTKMLLIPATLYIQKYPSHPYYDLSIQGALIFVALEKPEIGRA
jgi:hypothetical protein